MKNRFKKIIPLFILSFVFLFFTSFYVVNAQVSDVSDNYKLLAPIPCVGGPGTCGDANIQETNLEKYIPGIFNLAIGFSAAFAVLNLVWGGFQYLSTDAIQKKSEGRGRLVHSIQGLVLVIAAWLILNTINPNLLDINLSLENLSVKAPFGDSGTISGYREGTPLSADQVVASDQARSVLKAAGIEVYAGPCLVGQTKNCVNLNGLPDSASLGLLTIKNTCPTCGITITGATEGGHVTHGVGKPIVDIRSSDTQLNNYIINNQTSVRQTSLGPEYTVQISSTQTATFLRESSPPHWHVTFK